LPASEFEYVGAQTAVQFRFQITAVHFWAVSRGAGSGMAGMAAGRSLHRQAVTWDDFRHTNPEMLPAPLAVSVVYWHSCFTMFFLCALIL